MKKRKALAYNKTRNERHEAAERKRLEINLNKEIPIKDVVIFVGKPTTDGNKATIHMRFSSLGFTANQEISRLNLSKQERIDLLGMIGAEVYKRQERILAELASSVKKLPDGQES